MPYDIERPPHLPTAGSTIAEQPRPRANDPHAPDKRFAAILVSVRMLALIPKDEDLLGDELARLKDLGMPVVAARLADLLKHRAPRPDVPSDAVFDPGFGDQIDASASVVKTIGLSTEEARDLLGRHAKGDHGQLDGSVTNAQAIASGSGLVISRYDVFRPGVDDPKHSFGYTTESRRRRNRGETVDVVSLLAPGQRTRTIIVSSLDGVIV